jgi:hypothetical protein
LGAMCTNDFGSCADGTDTAMCTAKLEYDCGTSGLHALSMLSDCGTYASGRPLQLYQSGAYCSLHCLYFAKSSALMKIAALSPDFTFQPLPPLCSIVRIFCGKLDRTQHPRRRATGWPGALRALGGKCDTPREHPRCVQRPLRPCSSVNDRWSDVPCSCQCVPLPRDNRGSVFRRVLWACGRPSYGRSAVPWLLRAPNGACVHSVGLGG